jgi:hypothetical protein
LTTDFFAPRRGIRRWEKAPSAQRGAATRAGEHNVAGNLVATGWAIKPVPTETALLFRQPLLFFTLRAAAVHFAVAQVIVEKQPATGTFTAPRFMDNRFATGNWALEDRFALLTPVFPLKRLFAAWTFFSHRLTPAGIKYRHCL